MYILNFFYRQSLNVMKRNPEISLRRNSSRLDMKEDHKNEQLIQTTSLAERWMSYPLVTALICVIQIVKWFHAKRLPQGKKSVMHVWQPIHSNYIILVFSIKNRSNKPAWTFFFIKVIIPFYLFITKIFSLLFLGTITWGILWYQYI